MRKYFIEGKQVDVGDFMMTRYFVTSLVIMEFLGLNGDREYHLNHPGYKNRSDS